MSIWFPFYKGGYSDDSKTCMICFHHAGGSANTFNSLKLFNTDTFISVPVEIPGHGRRLRETPEKSITVLAEKVADEIYSEFGNCHIYIYGHSFGSLVAFETCYCLENKYGKNIEKLIVSGRNAPFEFENTSFQLSQGREAFINEMKRYGLIPLRMLENEEFMKYYEPVVYGDYYMLEAYRYDRNKIINAPVHLDYGDEDEDISEESADKWCEITNNSFSKTIHHGGHFFMFESGCKYFENIINEINSVQVRRIK